MEDQQNSIDEFFRQSLGDYREAPPAAAWDDVVSKLDADGPKPRSYFLRWPWISLLLLLLTVGGVWFMIANNNGKDKKPAITINTPVVKLLPIDVKNDSSTAVPAEGTHSTISEAPHTVNVHPARRYSSHRIAHSKARKNTDDNIQQPIVANKEHSKRHHATNTNRTRHQVAKASNNNQQPIATTNEGATEIDKGIIKSEKNSARKTARNRSVNVASKTSQQDVPASASKTDKQGEQTSTKQYLTRSIPTKAKRNKEMRSSPNNSQQEPVATNNNVPENQNAATNKPSNSSKRIAHDKVISNASNKEKQMVAAPVNDSRRKEKLAEKKPSKTKHLTAKTEQTDDSRSHSFTGKTKNAVTEKQEKQIVVAGKHKAEKAFTDKRLQKPVVNKKKGALNATKETSTTKRNKTAAPIAKDNKPEKQKKDDQLTSEDNPNSAPVTPAPKLPVAKKNEVLNPTAPAVDAKENTAEDRSNDNEEPSKDATEDSGGDGAQNTHPVQKHRRGLNLSLPVSLDVMAGYEWAFQKPAPNKGVVGLQFSWHLSTRISIGIIPAYSFGNIASQDISGGGLFGNLNPVQVDSTKVVDSIQGVVHNFYTYQTRQTYDSILVPKTIASGKFWQIELPLVFNYQPGNWRFYGGPSLNFGGKINLTTTGTQQSFTVNRRDSITFMDHQAPSDTFNNYFGVHLTPFSNYSATRSEASSMRIGYLAGIGYQYGGFLVDVSIHQQLTGYNNVAPSLQKVYSSPNFRINIGYRLFGPRPEQRNAANERNFLQRL